jgi:hypothetical protein
MKRFAFLVLSLLCFVYPGVTGAAEPFSITYDSVYTQSRYDGTRTTKTNQINADFARLKRSYPEITKDYIENVHVTSASEISRKCTTGPNTEACYSPDEKRIYLIFDQSASNTVIHELVHGTILGSTITDKPDYIEEGMAEYLSTKVTGGAITWRPSSAEYDEYAKLAKHIVQVLDVTTGGAGDRELAKMAFDEGLESGINSRFSRYASGNVYRQLNDLLHTKKYDEANRLLSAIATKARAASPTPSTSSVSPTPKATSSSSLLSNCDQNNASGFVFCNTLFGDKVTAQDYFSRFYAWAVGLAILGASGMIIWAGYRYTTSRGNPSEANAAKEMIISALVGLALLLLSYTILRFLGINLQ